MHGSTSEGAPLESLRAMLVSHDAGDLYRGCFEHLEDGVEERRRRLWESLSGVFGLAKSWEDLHQIPGA